jgi:hypothetical protein
MQVLPLAVGAAHNDWTPALNDAVMVHEDMSAFKKVRGGAGTIHKIHDGGLYDVKFVMGGYRRRMAKGGMVPTAEREPEREPEPQEVDWCEPPPPDAATTPPPAPPKRKYESCTPENFYQRGIKIRQLELSRDSHKKRADKHKRKRKHAERKYKRLVRGWNRREAKIITRELNQVCKAVRKEVGDWHDVKLV